MTFDYDGVTLARTLSPREITAWDFLFKTNGRVGYGVVVTPSSVGEALESEGLDAAAELLPAANHQYFLTHYSEEGGEITAKAEYRAGRPSNPRKIEEFTLQQLIEDIFVHRRCEGAIVLLTPEQKAVKEAPSIFTFLPNATAAELLRTAAAMLEESGEGTT